VRQLVAGAPRAGVLHRDGVHTTGAQGLREQSQSLGHAADDEDVVRVCLDTTGTREPADQLVAQRGAPPGVAIAEIGGGGVVEDRSFRAEPRGSGEGRQVRDTRREVQFGARRRWQRHPEAGGQPLASGAIPHQTAIGRTVACRTVAGRTVACRTIPSRTAAGRAVACRTAAGRTVAVLAAPSRTAAGRASLFRTPA
jgi:hypothetical protein